MRLGTLPSRPPRRNPKRPESRARTRDHASPARPVRLARFSPRRTACPNSRPATGCRFAHADARTGSPSRSEPIAICGSSRRSNRNRAWPDQAGGRMPTAWGPSMQTANPNSRARRQMASAGSTTAVGLLTWLKTSSRVRGVTPANKSATTSWPTTALRQAGGDQPCPDRVPTLLPDPHVRAVLVVREQHFLTGGQRKALGHDIMANVALSTSTRSSPAQPTNWPTRRRVSASALKLAVQKVDRVALQPLLPGLASGQHRTRRGAGRAVVQIGDALVERPLAGKGRRAFRGNMPGKP